MFKLKKEDEEGIRTPLIKTVKSKPFPLGYYIMIGEERVKGTYIDENGNVLNFGEQVAGDADIAEIEKLPTESLVYLVFNGVHKGDHGWDELIEWKSIYGEIAEETRSFEGQKGMVTILIFLSKIKGFYGVDLLKCGLSNSTAYRAIKELENIGLIDSTPKGNYKKKYYELTAVGKDVATIIKNLNESFKKIRKNEKEKGE